MNIFVISSDAQECAEALDDLRLNKMILETAQLLSTALHVHNSPSALFVYKKTHVNHPCSIWTRENRGNYLWLLNYFIELLQERIDRGYKQHKCASLYPYFGHGAIDIPDGKLTPFANCSLYKNIDTFDAYRLTLKDKWANDKRPPKWTNSQKPSWA